MGALGASPGGHGGARGPPRKGHRTVVICSCPGPSWPLCPSRAVSGGVLMPLFGTHLSDLARGPSGRLVHRVWGPKFDPFAKTTCFYGFWGGWFCSVWLLGGLCGLLLASFGVLCASAGATGSTQTSHRTVVICCSSSFRGILCWFARAAFLFWFLLGPPGRPARRIWAPFGPVW